MPPSRRPDVAVTMCTYRRLEGLEDAVRALVEQCRRTDRATCRTIVIDNDPDGGAAPVVGRVPGVEYVHEPRPGIAAARNAGLTAAEGADAVVFIDDDETPGENWLEMLVGAWLDGNCDGVSGPVVYEFSRRPDTWVIASGVFDRLARPSGTVLTEAATNNLLLSTEILRRTGLRFDDRFGLTGGSDSALTRDLVARGARLVWCDEAVVRERVPPTRSEGDWVIRRSRRTANSGARLDIMSADGGLSRLRTRAEYSARGLWRVGRGVCAGVGATLAGDSTRAGRAATDVARGKGALAAALGRHDMEYRR